MKSDDKKEQTKINESTKAGKMAFERRRFSIGVFSTATVLAVIAMFVIVNIFVSRLNISFDMTHDQRFSLSEESLSFIAQIDEPITIYTLFRTGESVVGGFISRVEIEEMLNRYAAESSNIRIVNRDPYIYWGFVNRFVQETGAPIPPGSIIVESDRRFRVIQLNELVRETIDFAHLQMTGELRSDVHYDIEPRVTNALVFVTQEAPLIAYQMVGHGQEPLSDSMINFLFDAGFEIREHDTSRGPIPEDNDILIVTTPRFDISVFEREMIYNYIKGGGHAVFLIGHTQTPLPNLLEVIERFGITVFNESLLLDFDTNYHIFQVPFNITPSMIGHDISVRVQPHGGNLYMPISVPVVVQDIPSGVNAQSLIRTSNSGWLEIPDDLLPHLNITAAQRSGQFSIAMGITHEVPVVMEGFVGFTRPSRFAVFGNDFMLGDENSMTLNRRYFVETMNWIIDRGDRDVFIPSRLLQAPERVFVTTWQSTMMKVFIWGVFPAFILGIGVAVWLKRRNS